MQNENFALWNCLQEELLTHVIGKCTVMLTKCTTTAEEDIWSGNQCTNLHMNKYLSMCSETHQICSVQLNST